MFRLFLILIFLHPLTLVAQSNDLVRVVIGDTRGSIYVYEGDDEDMPIGQDFLFSVDINHENLFPSSVPELLLVMEKIAPTWFKLAMVGAKSNDRSCAVVVNNKNYHDFFIDWVDFKIMGSNKAGFKMYLNEKGYSKYTSHFYVGVLHELINQSFCMYLSGREVSDIEKFFFNAMK